MGGAAVAPCIPSGVQGLPGLLEGVPTTTFTSDQNQTCRSSVPAPSPGSKAMLSTSVPVHCLRASAHAVSSAWDLLLPAPPPPWGKPRKLGQVALPHVPTAQVSTPQLARSASVIRVAARTASAWPMQSTEPGPQLRNVPGGTRSPTPLAHLAAGGPPPPSASSGALSVLLCASLGCHINKPNAGAPSQTAHRGGAGIPRPQSS